VLDAPASSFYPPVFDVVNTTDTAIDINIEISTIPVAVRESASPKNELDFKRGEFQSAG
jgi:hypothetical protein